MDFFNFVKDRNLNKVKTLLETSPSLITSLHPSSGERALLLAAQAGHAEIVELLLSKGASPCDGGETVGYVGAINGHIHVLEVLCLPLLNLSDHVEGKTPLFGAVEGNELATVRWLLSLRGKRCKEVDQRDVYGGTALMVSVQLGYCDIVAELLTHGADPTLVDEDGTNAFTVVPFEKVKSGWDVRCVGCIYSTW